jgi:hypothetical protein
MVISGRQADAGMCANPPHALIVGGDPFYTLLNTFNALVKFCDQS